MEINRLIHWTHTATNMFGHPMFKRYGTKFFDEHKSVSNDCFSATSTISWGEGYTIEIRLHSLPRLTFFNTYQVISHCVMVIQAVVALRVLAEGQHFKWGGEGGQKCCLLVVTYLLFFFDFEGTIMFRPIAILLMVQKSQGQPPFRCFWNSVNNEISTTSTGEFTGISNEPSTVALSFNFQAVHPWMTVVLTEHKWPRFQPSWHACWVRLLRQSERCGSVSGRSKNVMLRMVGDGITSFSTVCGDGVGFGYNIGM